MMALTGVEQDDWSMEFDAEHVHFGQDGPCKSYKKLLESYQTERDNFQRARTEILGYQMSLESLEVMLKTHEKNEYAWACPNHLIKDCNLHERTFQHTQTHKSKGTQGSRETRPVWNNIQRVNHSNFARNSRYPHQRKSFIPSAVLTRDGLISTARPKMTQTVPSKSTANVTYQGTARSRVPQAVFSRSTDGSYYPRMDNRRPRISSYSPSSRSSTTRTPHRPQRPKKIVKSIWVKKGSTVGSQAVLPQTVKKSAMISPKQTWKPKGKYLDSVNRGQSEEDLKGLVSLTVDAWKISGKGTIKTSCLDFEKVSYVEELKFNLLSVSQICDKKHNVLFTDKECLILSPKFKFVDEDLVILRAPRKNDVYSLDLKNIIPSGGITCLVAKATEDEAVLWHRRLGHVNFKNINKLVKGNLVRGLPSKTFKLDHSCVACRKGKQHRASCKKIEERTVREPLELLHMDLFGPVSVESVNRKKYCLVVTDDCSKFSWVFFLAYKDETYDMLHDLIVGLENRLRHKVKTIRTPQQNGVAERKNRTLIEAARTMLADSLLPIQFWAEAVNTACYVLNRVLVTKPQMKTPYEILMGRSPNISFMRPFGCSLTILNTLDHLGKFDGKSEEGYLLGYSTNSKGFRVYNRVTRKVQDCLHVNFLENQENQKGKGPDWMFDLDLLTPSMNYIPVRKENYADSKEQGISCDDVEDMDDQQFIVHTAQPMPPEERTAAKEVKLSSEDQALHDELVSLMHQESLAKAHNDDQRIAFEEEKRRISIAKGKEHVDSTFTLSTANTPPQSTGNTPTDSDDDTTTDGVFSTNSFDAEEGGVADYNNLDSTIDVPSTPTLRIHKIHPQSQIIGKSTAGVQTRRKLQDSTSNQHQALLSFIYKQNRTNHKDQQTCLFACFLSQEEPKKVSQALADESWVEAMQEELLQFKLQENKARLVAQGYRQEEGVDYDEVFAPVARIEAIRLFLAFASFMGFIVYQMDVKSAFLYGNITEEVYVKQPPGFEDPAHPNKVYRVVKALYGLHQAPRAWIEEISCWYRDMLMISIVDSTKSSMVSMIGCLMYLTASRPDIMFAVCLCARFQVTPKVSHLHAVKRIFSFTDSDYAGQPMTGRSSQEDVNNLGRKDYPQWKYLVHVLLHCLSPKSTSWEQFGTNIASALVVEGVDRPQDFIPSVSLPSKVFTFMRKHSTKFSCRITPLTPSMLEVVSALAAEEEQSTSPHSRAASSARVAQASTQSAVISTYWFCTRYFLSRSATLKGLLNTKDCWTSKENQNLKKQKRRRKKHKKKVSSVKLGRNKDEGTLSEEHNVQEEDTTHPFFDDIADQDAAVTPDLERKSDGTEEVNIEEKEASNVKSGETEELDLETTQSTARQGTITPRTLNFAGPSSPLRPIQVMDSEEQHNAAEVLVAISRPRGLSIPGPIQTQPQQPTQGTDPKDKGKGILVEEPKKKKLTLQQIRALETTNDEEVARKIQAEWDAEEERKRFEELKKTKPKTTLRKPTSLAQEKTINDGF
ncbi:putative ribonuclease H-like domain-containing protein [Tanacetum coccineum]|uniref:Ribonuclease H-like domain-containing protein n=1 Tax=Tanacetum coccineum TaxID=301880 RepID=A0ABQ4YND1_9ASTR